jgi:hypothetical protein
VRADPEIAAGDVLNETEKDILRLLSAENGCLAHSKLLSRASQLGVKRATLFQCLAFSPILSRRSRGHYRLVGSSCPHESLK